MKLEKYGKRMAINMLRLFLEIAVWKFFDFGRQIINWAACNMTPIFMDTCIFRYSEIALLYYFIFCYCNLWLHTNTSRLIESNFHKLIINWEVHSSLLSCSFAKFSFDNCSFCVTGVHSIKDFTEWLNLYLISAYCYILNFFQ